MSKDWNTFYFSGTKIYKYYPYGLQQKLLQIQILCTYKKQWASCNKTSKNPQDLELISNVPILEISTLFRGFLHISGDFQIMFIIANLERDGF